MNTRTKRKVMVGLFSFFLLARVLAWALTYASRYSHLAR